MSNSNLASLPPSMLHKILSKVATSHLWDFGSPRIAFSEFNEIGREEYFYRSADLFNLNDWIDEANALRTFRLRCYQAGNLEAIYMRGMYEFFVLHLLDEGRRKIRLAGERGLLWAKYVDGMLNIAFSVDARGFVHNYPSFSHEFVDRMNYMITTSLSSGHWGYEKPEVFMSLLERINPKVSHDSWDFCNEIHLTAGHWPIED
ncbi:hypothetical protein HID58_060029 [Brassica napus]|uniref:At2g35280-like TPR domain-containing protein n=1 Tax=Brassica napus TaxID=3708 RepID=A0ABQ7ZUU4_BRANA|nr:hypothetical protein HID58_060029 [Brassica napus]